MSIVIRNNIAAQMTLGELNKNQSKLSKSLEKISSGEKIKGAKDNASGYSISEKMRVRIRALEQASQNVQNGSSLLKTADEGIQQQIDIMRTIKEKVINAANDHNTDVDRTIIQKEVDQLYDQFDQTAFYTNYNSKTALLGNGYWKTLSSWVVSDKVVLDHDSEMNVIPDVYPTLDGEQGAFDIFTPYNTSATTISPLLGSESTANLSGGTDGTPSVITYDFSTVYSTVDDLVSIAVSNGSDPLVAINALSGGGFSVTGYNQYGSSSTEYYVLTTDPSENYNNPNNYKSYNKIDISGCTDTTAIASAIADAINARQGNYTTAEATDGVLTLTSKNLSTDSDKSNIQSSSVAEKTITPAGRQGATATGLSVPQNLSGGKDSKYETVTVMVSPAQTTYDPKTDKKTSTPAVYSTKSFVIEQGIKAKLEDVDVSSVANGSGITINGNSATAYVKFVSGSSIIQDADGVWLVGKEANGKVSLSGFNNYTGKTSSTGIYLSMEGGKMTLEAMSTGTTQNNYGIVTDGFAEIPAGNPVTYAEVNGLKATKDVDWTMQNATDGDRAAYDFDLSSYDTTDADKLKEFIKELSGKDFIDSYYACTFIDSANLAAMQPAHSQYISVDLNEVRQAVEGGKTIADAFIDTMTSQSAKFSSVTGDNGEKILRLTASDKGRRGNSENIRLTKTEFAHYDIDFNSWFANNSAAVISQPSVEDYLDGKGLRVYCATHYSQWYNIQFYNDEEVYKAKPKGTSDADFTPIPIDVSGVTDAQSLVKAIYEQGAPQFQAIDHYLQLAADFDEGILIIYDTRDHNPLDPIFGEEYPYKQEMGAKIADGIMEDVIKVKKNLFIHDLVIQDTDKASMNFRAKIPDTRLDSICGILPSLQKTNLRDYSLSIKDDRIALLGKPPEEIGLLDKGLDYLLDATVLVGAQRARLEFDETNLVTQIENDMASESTIRDADMAKEMTDYTKANVLVQSAQAMLAQANQNSSAVLSLLQ